MCTVQKSWCCGHRADGVSSDLMTVSAVPNATSAVPAATTSEVVGSVANPKVRFAPAPTGYLHVGSARTALFNWLFARGQGGEMILRIEDTDAALKKQAYVNAITEPLRWLGFDWDSGPYFQSDRRELYTVAIEQLVASGAAYYCDLSRGEIADRATAAGLPIGYHGWSRDRDVRDAPGVVVRFRAPDSGVTVVDDRIRGRVSFPNEAIEDFVVRRGDGSPTFLIANAVDDSDMNISHVIRGEDLLNTAPRVLMLWKALDYGDPPTYAHLPLLVNAQRRKLSKRRDDVALDIYRRNGYLPEAIVNYLALLGWSPPDGVEIRPLAEFVELFNLSAVKSASACFDPVRLAHINSTYIKSLSAEEFAGRVKPFLTGFSMDDDAGAGSENEAAASDTDAGIAAASEIGSTIVKAGTKPRLHGTCGSEGLRVLAPDVQQRITTLADAADWVGWILCSDVHYDAEAWHKAMVKGEAAAEVLATVAARLADDDFSSAPRLESIVMSVGDDLTERMGVRVKSQPPVRVALSGTAAGLPLWEPMRLLGKDRTLARLRSALSHLRSQNRPQTQ